MQDGCKNCRFLHTTLQPRNARKMPEQTWDENLPEGCPPPAAKEAPGLKVLRLVSAVPITDHDLWSTCKLQPTRVVKPGGECCARSISAFLKKEDIQRIQSIARAHRDKVIAEISLETGAGVVLASPGPGSHVDWWRTAGYIPPQNNVRDVTHED